MGPYEVTAKIGQGGMGEVYQARDTRLDRTVAIKVLPEHVASDPDLKQRFEWFLVVKEGGGTDTPAQPILIQNWFEELKRLVPTP